MSQRVAGERARWLAAVLMVASIAAASVIVRIWPVEQAAPARASRDIHLSQPAPAPVPEVATSTPPPSEGPRTTRPGQRLHADVAAVPPAESVVAVVEPVVVALDAAPQPAAAAVVDTPVADIGLPLALADVRPTPAVDIAIETPGPVAVSPDSAVPAAAASRGIAELPAVAVTRAVTIAGRGIMTGLKATTAILRAPF